MKTIYKISTGLFILFIVCFCSCTRHLERVNINPNGADPETTNPNLVLTDVLTEAGKAFVNLGFGNIMGVMQYTQKDGWGTDYNNYEWDGDNPWEGYYDILRNDKYVYERAKETDNKLLVGISQVMRAMMFGLITDLYGGAPYTDALKGAKGGNQYTFPKYTDQKTIYLGVLATLDSANTILSKPDSAYTAKVGDVDVYYQGNRAQWRKLANSLALRYYMRISAKLPDVAQKGIEKIVNNPDKYPIITSADDDCVMDYSGNSDANSWPTNVKFDADSSNYRRVKMCNTFVTRMLNLDDPRLGVWASKVQIPLEVDKTLPSGTDTIKTTTVNGENQKVRYLSPDILSARGLTLDDINQNMNYVGLPVAMTAPQAYNMSPDPHQGSHNPHVSWLNSIYTQTDGPLLKARLMTAAEVHFIIAEAKAVDGWTNANAEQQYEAGIQASFDAWGIGSAYPQYIQQSKVQFDGTQKQIMMQKWISNWSRATESWFDFRRTGYPEIHGVENQTVAPELPLRFYYPKDEQDLNSENEEAAAQKFKVTQYSAFGADGKYNSPWSKMWLLQGMVDPWK
jgi:hypothetical protein